MSDPVHPLQLFDPQTIAPTLGTLDISDTTTAQESIDAIKTLAGFNGCTLGVVRFQGLTPYRRPVRP